MLIMWDVSSNCRPVVNYSLIYMTSRHQSQDSTADITPVNMSDPEPALHHKSTSLRIIKMVAIQNGEPPIESVL